MVVSVRCYAELNDFLIPDLRYRTFEREFAVSPQAKDLIEGLGIPHTEVDLILVNSEPSPFTYRLADGDRLSVYPVFEAIDLGPAALLRPEPLRITRFAADTHLGSLARYLRMAGFDTVYCHGYDDEQVARLGAQEHRIVLTRDRGLLMRGEVTHGYCVRSPHPRRQLVEVLRRFDLADRIHPFARCLRCNTPLDPASPEAVWARIPEFVAARHRRFWECRGCRRVYWAGSHQQRMQDMLNEVRRELAPK